MNQGTSSILDEPWLQLAGVLKQFLADWNQATISPSSTAKQAKGKQKAAGKAAAKKAPPVSKSNKKAASKDPKVGTNRTWAAQLRLCSWPSSTNSMTFLALSLQDECLAKFMQELDDRINKAKK